MNETHQQLFAGSGVGFGKSFGAWTPPDSDSNVQEAKSALVCTMREEAESLRNDLQSAQTRCRKLQHLIEKRNQEVDDLKSAIASMKTENGKRQNEYMPCDELRYRRWQEDSAQLKTLRMDLDCAILEKRSLQSTVAELRLQVDKISKLKDFYQVKVDKLEQAIETREKDAYDQRLAEKERVESELAAKDAAIAELETRIAEYSTKLGDVKDDLRQSITEKQSLQSAWMDLDKQFEDMSKLKDKYQEKVDNLEKQLLTKTVVEETAIKQRRIDEMSKLFRDKGDIETRLRMTEGHLGELRRDNQILKDELSETVAQLQQSEETCQKLRTGMDEAMDKVGRNKKDKDNFEKLYKSYKEKTEVEIMQKDAKIAERDEFITHLQCRISSPERMMSTLFRDNGDIETRLRMTEEHLGELRRDNQILRDELSETVAQLQQSEEAYRKLRTGMEEAMDKIGRNKKDKDYFEKLYKSYKDKTEVEIMQKDAKISQQDKLITHLQCRISSPKRMCCWAPEKKAPGQMAMDDLGKALDVERAKNVDLRSAVRRLQQELKEKRMRRSFSADRIQVTNGN